MKHRGARRTFVSLWGAAVFVVIGAACSQANRTESRETVATARSTLSAGTPWFPVGPLGAQPQFVGTPLSGGGVPASPDFNQTGRGISIAVNPLNAFDVYFGTAGGGLWENPALAPLQDASKTPSSNPWSLVFSAPNASAIGAVAVDPASCTSTRCNTLWVGTGEAGVRRETFFGSGLYKVSFSMGEVGGGFTATPEPGSQNITGGAIGTVVLAGTTSAQKVYFTVTGANATTGYDATVFHPAPSAGFGVFLFDEVASTMTRENVPPNDPPTHNLPGGLALATQSGNSFLLAGFFNRGIYRKMLPSGTWCPVNPGAPAVAGCPAPSAVLQNAATSRFDHVALAASGSTVYATFADCSDRWSANGAGINSDAPVCEASVFISQDAGQTWSAGDTNIDTYSLYDHALSVSPLNSAEVYLGGYLANVSTNGGQKFSSFFPNVHPDIHVIFPSSHKWTSGKVDDTNGTQHVVYIGADGGLSVCLFDPSNPGAATTVPVVQPSVFEIDRLGVLACAAGQTCGTLLLGGTNDNGTVLYNGGRLWSTVSGADVGDVVLLSANSGVVSWYASQPTLIGTSGVDDLANAVPFAASGGIL